MALEMVAAGLVASISAASIRRILPHHKLKPWRHHLWLSAKLPSDQAFIASVEALVSLHTRVLEPAEVVLCLDEKTSLQPRTRLSPTKPTRPGRVALVEHEYIRRGALNLFAAFDTRTGRVYGLTRPRKRQSEFIEFLEQLEASFEARSLTSI